MSSVKEKQRERALRVIEWRSRIAEVADHICCDPGPTTERDYRLLEKSVMDLVRAIEALAPKAGVHRKATTFYRHWVERAYDDAYSSPWVEP